MLTYLDKGEKEKLCSIIHDILKERGGCWITADIGLKNKESKLGLQFNEMIIAYNARQNIEENSFSDYQEAENFFNKMGFVIDKVAKVKSSEMSSFKYMIKSLSIKQLFKIRNGGKIFATWRLKAV